MNAANRYQVNTPPHASKISSAEDSQVHITGVHSIQAQTAQEVMSSRLIILAKTVNIGSDDICYLHQNAKLSNKMIVVRKL